jgi:MtN3 and saliva related transmembrane protein
MTGGQGQLVTDYIGYIAGFLSTFALAPQIIRIHKLKSAREISVIFDTSLLLGIMLWLVYGIMLRLIPIIVWNSIGATLTATLLWAKVKYGR